MPRKPSRTTTSPRRPRATARPEEDPGDIHVSWLRAVFDSAALGIARLDASARIIDANGAFEAFLGLALPAMRGRHLREFAVAEDAESMVTMVAEAASGSGGAATRDVRFVRPDACMAWGALTISTVHADGEPGFIAVTQDITRRKALEAELLHQAFHDPLTGLANRALFTDRVDHALAHCARSGARIGVLFVDLDDFKTINDTQGHAAGDVVLQRVAATLLNATRGCDTVCRLGGDEFAVLLERVTAGEGPEVAAQRIVNALARPIETGSGRLVTVGASIGIAIQASAESRDEVLRNADVALYEAKTRTRGRWVVYDPQMHAALVDKVRLEADLRSAIERCQLAHRPGLEKTGTYPRFDAGPAQTQISLAYQPIVDMGTGALSGFEALLRWTHPERGDVPPTTFVPVAEDSGLVIPLGRWVLRNACQQASRWNAGPSPGPITVTVNVSARQLQDEGLAFDVDAALRESGLPPSCLILEITESVIMHEPSAARARLQELKHLGVRIAIDDFGTGYSSLSHLQQFPVDILKIDRSFLHRMHQGAHDVALVRTIIALAKMLSLRTIAEGVEDAEQQEQLRALGCDSAQGFLFGRPMTADEAGQVFAIALGRP